MVVCLILIALAGVFAAGMDKLQFNYLNSIFRFLPSGWWDPSKSWKNKYSKADGMTPRFLWSTSLLVWVTDAWHLFQFLHYKVLIFAILFYHKLFFWPIDFIILHTLFTGTKELFFHYIFYNKYGSKN